MAETLTGNLAARVPATRPCRAGQRETGYWTVTACLRRTGTGAATSTIKLGSTMRRESPGVGEAQAWGQSSFGAAQYVAKASSAC